MEHHKIVKMNIVLSSWTDFDFPIFFLSNIRKRNLNQKGSEQPQITDKNN
jgi:hypothetical protein